MAITMQEHLRESVLKTALLHLLRNSQKSPDRAARNIQELLLKFKPDAAAEYFNPEELLSLLKTCSREECLARIMDKLTP